MRIGELATKTGVSTRALRYYEEHQLLASERTPSGQRVYPEAAVRRVDMIQRLYAAGLSSKTILGMMPCLSSGESTPELVDLLVSERNRIEKQINDLQDTRNELNSIIDNAAAVMTTGNPCQPQ